MALEHDQEPADAVDDDRDRHRLRPLPGSCPRRPRAAAPARRCRRRAPGATATPPSAAWRRQTDSGRMICVETPAATPTSGPPISAARTMTGVDAVYQLRGPSWTTTRSAAAAATTSATAIGNDVSSAAPATIHPERRRDGRDERDPDRDAGAAGRVGDAWSRTASSALAPSPPCRSWTCHPQLIKRERRPRRYPPFRGGWLARTPSKAVLRL